MINIKEISMIFVLVFGIFLLFPTGLNGFSVDNHLVSARNDCFERIALEAMLPIEKTFRTEDTNALKTCKDKCTQAGDKCQSISFGVHRRGNGTCQLSTEKYGATSGRPSGVIFDPDFDLYVRKSNCFDLSDNTLAPTKGVAVTTADAGEGEGGVLATTHPLKVLSNFPGAEPSVLTANPAVPTNPTLITDHSLPPTLVYGSTEFYGDGPIASQAPKTPEADRLLFSHDLYPLYKNPMLYEQNYPAPNEEVYFPGGYASNVPEVEANYRPGQAVDGAARPASGPPRPMFGMGYGNGYSYGKPEQYRPSEAYPHGDRDHTSPPGHYSNDRHERPERPDRFDRPGYPNRPDQAERPLDRPPGSNNMHPSLPSYSQTFQNYYPRPEHTSSSPTWTPDGALPTNMAPTNGNRPPVDYTNRPDPPQPNSRPETSTVRPSYAGHAATNETNGYDFGRRNGTGVRPMNTNYNDDKTIAIFFNPDDYQQHKKRPGGYGDRSRLGYPMDAMKGNFNLRKYRAVSGKCVLNAC